MENTSHFLLWQNEIADQNPFMEIEDSTSDDQDVQFLRPTNKSARKSPESAVLHDNQSDQNHFSLILDQIVQNAPSISAGKFTLDHHSYHQTVQQNDNLIQGPNQFNNLFKIYYVVQLTKQFPQIIRKFMCQLLNLSDCPQIIKSSKKIQNIKRGKVETLIEFIHQFQQIFCFILTEDNCVSLLMNAYKNHIRDVKVPKNTKIRIFIQLYHNFQSCFEQNAHLGNLKKEVIKLSSKFN
jgi:hypothetical protein